MPNEIATNAGPLMSFIERAAVDPSFDVAKFGELLRLQRDAEHDQARRAFNVAMSKAQAEMPAVTRDARNTHLNNKYAKLETIDAAMRPVYTKHGFSVRYGSAPADGEGMIRITCTVAHDGGYFEEQYLDAPTGNAGSQGGRTATTPVQAVGSAITYLRRYLLAMVFNVVLADEDDDGEGQRRQRAAPPPPRQAEPPKYPELDEQNGAKWLVNLEMLLANAASQDEVVDISAHQTVGKATADAPAPVKARISELLAQAYGRFAEKEWIDADTGEIHIRGEEKLAAG